jgi:hypothetical protein
MNQPFCMSSDGKYLKGESQPSDQVTRRRSLTLHEPMSLSGDVGAYCYLVSDPGNPDPEAGTTDDCKTTCSVKGKTPVCDW